MLVLIFAIKAKLKNKDDEHEDEEYVVTDVAPSAPPTTPTTPTPPEQTPPPVAH